MQEGRERGKEGEREKEGREEGREGGRKGGREGGRKENMYTISLQQPGAVAHTCNPSYSGDRDQEGFGSKPGENSLCDPISKKPNTKKGQLEWLKM
jgi:hypothetical protein